MLETGRRSFPVERGVGGARSGRFDTRNYERLIECRGPLHRLIGGRRLIDCGQRARARRARRDEEAEGPVFEGKV